jgi:hypothetical protein
MSALRVLTAAALVALAACGNEEPLATADPTAPPELSYQEPVWFLCDAENGGRIFVAEQPDESGAFTLRTFDKKAGKFRADRTLTKGEPEGAAGSVLTPILDNGKPVMEIRTINPEMLADPEAPVITPVRSLKVGDETVDCRWADNIRFLGFTVDATILVTRNEGQFALQTLPFSGKGAGVSIETGVEEISRRSTTLMFDKGEERRILYAPRVAHATLTEWRNGERKADERVLAYITPPIEYIYDDETEREIEELKRKSKGI